MRMLPFWATSLLLILWSCQTDAPEAAEDNATPATDSLALRYQEYLEKRPLQFPTQQVKEAAKLHPVDEAPTDTAFYVFREALRDKVLQKDVIYLLSVVDPEVAVNFALEPGRQGFIKAWELDNPDEVEASEVWPVLNRLLSQGGLFEDNRTKFFAPYPFAAWPEEVPMIGKGAIVGAGVRLRAEPSIRAKVIGSLSFDIVDARGYSTERTTINGETQSWAQIRTANGKEGYVWGKYFCEPLGYRMGFEKNPEGKWRIAFMEAGD